MGVHGWALSRGAHTTVCSLSSLELEGLWTQGCRGVECARQTLDHEANKRVHKADTPQSTCKDPMYTSSRNCKHNRLTNDLHNGLHAATAGQSAWSETRACLAPETCEATKAAATAKNCQHIACDESRLYPNIMTLRQHDDLASLSDAAAARQSAWSVSRAYLAVITMGQQNNQAGLSEPLGLSTGQELVKHHLHHQINEWSNGCNLPLTCAV